MDDNVFTEADASAPELEATAAIEPVENTTPEEQSAEQEAPKTFSQEDLDAIVGKRLAREQRKWEREQAQRAEEMLARREKDSQQRAMLESYHEREEAARDKYDDFEQVAYNPNLPITDAMAMAIQASDVGPDVIYHLGVNVKDAQRISRLDPILQAREIGMIEARLSAEPTFKKTSNAPAPIAPVNARTSGAPTFDTTDPRAVKSMSTSDWIEAERLRQIKKYEAQRNR